MDKYGHSIAQTTSGTHGAERELTEQMLTRCGEKIEALFVSHCRQKVV